MLPSGGWVVKATFFCFFLSLPLASSFSLVSFLKRAIFHFWLDPVSGASFCIGIVRQQSERDVLVISLVNTFCTGLTQALHLGGYSFLFLFRFTYSYCLFFFWLPLHS